MKVVTTRLPVESIFGRILVQMIKITKMRLLFPVKKMKIMAAMHLRIKEKLLQEGNLQIMLTSLIQIPSII